MAQHFGYYDGYASMAFRCGCGWTGPFSELRQECYRELFDASCPRCDKMLAIVSFPTDDETRQAAARGNKEAERNLKSVRARQAFRERYAATELREPAQLPDLEGSELHFDWLSEEQSGETHMVIRLRPDGHEVWRELQAWENWRHLVDVIDILRAKYGPRFRSFTVSAEAEGWLYGDDFGGTRAVAEAMAKAGIKDLRDAGRADEG